MQARQQYVKEKDVLILLLRKRTIKYIVLTSVVKKRPTTRSWKDITRKKGLRMVGREVALSVG